MMRRWWRQALRWGGLLLAAGGLILIYMWARRRGPPAMPIGARLVTEVQAIRAAAEADKMEAAVGRATAVAAIEKQYAADIQALSEAQLAEAAVLTRDPAALAQFLVRASRGVLSLLLALALSIPMQVIAQSIAQPIAGIVCDTDHPGRCSAPIRAGAPAPFDGQVLTTTLAVALAQRAASCDTVTQIERELAVRRARADFDYELRLASVEGKASRREADRLAAALVEAEERLEAERSGFFRQPWLWALIGATVTAGAVGIGYRLIGG